MNMKKIKERAWTLLIIVGIISGAFLFVEAVRIFLWACFEAGIPM